ncbi:unnamed protein product [Schistosoma curassoni]|uniref:Peptidase A2 domain-containing protein n=1 Tax=Schistosoma curassoni TaxID=6186 RepID=A0A183KM19_9TREM|nr:unnamed protein product [Schistosoma curassoni]
MLSSSTTSNSSLHIQKRLYLSSGAFDDFIIDTGSIKSIISVGKLKSLDFEAIIKPIEVYITSITVLSLNCVISGILRSHNNSNISNHRIDVAMEPVMGQLDIHSNFDTFEDYMERFKICTMTKDVEDVNIVAHFLIFIGKEDNSLLNVWRFLTSRLHFPIQLSSNYY